MSTEASDRKRSGETLRCPANDERRTTTVLPPVISTEASDCERSGETRCFSATTNAAPPATTQSNHQNTS
jgi:hypothetical protein